MPSLFMKTTSVATAALCAWVCYKEVQNGNVRRLLSVIVESLSDEPVTASELVRDGFSTTVLTPPVPVEGHTHADAAALRSTATIFARDLSRHIGSRLFSLEMSRSDQRKGLAGIRQWFWAKDTNVSNRNDKPQDDDLEYICDVDYYVDMPKLLSSRAKPLLLYTVVPEDAASSGTDDTSFYFDDQSVLHTFVAGGGSYNHQLWDYAGDSVITTKTFLGFTYALTTYALERKQVGYSRQLVLLSPIKTWGGFGAFVASFLLEGKRLERFNPVVRTSDGSTFTRFIVHRRGKTEVTTAKTSTFLCATIPAETDDAISTVAKLSTTNLMLPTVASWVGKDARAEAAILTEYFRSAVPFKHPIVYPAEMAVRAYQYEPSNFDQDAKPKLEAFMSPIVHGAFAPVTNAASERACVDGRINRLKKPEPKMFPFLTQCMTDFTNEIVGNIVLEPMCYEHVADKQTTAAQKFSLSKAVLAGPLTQRVLKCFVKAEAYPDVKDPRNISTYNDKDKLTMAQFALALSEHLKQFAWYGPGKTPVQVAERVAEICSKAMYANISDYHRMDGTITYLLREVDRMVFMRIFANHRSELNELFRDNAGNKGILPQGTCFDQGSSHGSGCSATSTSQTLRATFASYLAFRNATNPATQRRYTSREAFEALGIHLGDDGLEADLPVESHIWAASKVGLVLEASTVQRGDRGVTFLARYYSPSVWFGRLDSMCDIKRQLSKFHTTVRMPSGTRAQDKLLEKAQGYIATDANTPVIGALCKRATELCCARVTQTLGCSSWWSKFDHSVQFPNDNSDGWMDADLECQFPELDVGLFTKWLSGVSTPEELLSAPLCAEPKPATAARNDIVVDEDVLQAKTIEPSNSTIEGTPQEETRSDGEKLTESTTKSVSKKPQTNVTKRTRNRNVRKGL